MKEINNVLTAEQLEKFAEIANETVDFIRQNPVLENCEITISMESCSIKKKELLLLANMETKKL